MKNNYTWKDNTLSNKLLVLFFFILEILSFLYLIHLQFNQDEGLIVAIIQILGSIMLLAKIIYDFNILISKSIKFTTFGLAIGSKIILWNEIKKIKFKSEIIQIGQSISSMTLGKKYEINNHIQSIIIIVFNTKEFEKQLYDKNIKISNLDTKTKFELEIENSKKLTPEKKVEFFNKLNKRAKNKEIRRKENLFKQKNSKN